MTLTGCRPVLRVFKTERGRFASLLIPVFGAVTLSFVKTNRLVIASELIFLAVQRALLRSRPPCEELPHAIKCQELPGEFRDDFRIL